MTTEENKSNSKRIILLALFTLLSAGGAWLAYSNYDKGNTIDELSDKIKDKDQTIDEQVKRIQALKDELVLMQGQRDNLQLDNSELKVRIEELNKMLAQAKSGAALSKADKQALQNQLSVIRKERDKLSQEIKDLQAKNDTLIANNDSLKTSKSRITDSLNSLKSKETEYKNTIAIASILEADKFKLEALDAKGNVHDGDEIKAKKLVKLKVTFSLKKNAVAKENSKLVYFRLIEPTGAAIFDMATGGGTIEAEGKTISYTGKKEVDYSKTGVPVSFVYEKPGEYQKGTHKIEIYCEGHQIGETSFLVK